MIVKPYIEVKENVQYGAYMAANYIVRLLVLNAPFDSIKAWRKQVYSSLSSVSPTLDTHSLPSAEVMLNDWIEPKFDADAVLILIHEARNEADVSGIRNYNSRHIRDILLAYFAWLTKELAEHSTVNQDAVFQMLDHLGIPG